MPGDIRGACGAAARLPVSRVLPLPHRNQLETQDLTDAPHQPQAYETRLRVRYAETDQMGVVYHSNYIIWFEVGRVEMLRELGFTYREMERDDGTNLAVVEARC